MTATRATVIALYRQELSGGSADSLCLRLAHLAVHLPLGGPEPKPLPPLPFVFCYFSFFYHLHRCPTRTGRLSSTIAHFVSVIPTREIQLGVPFTNFILLAPFACEATIRTRKNRKGFSVRSVTTIRQGSSLPAQVGRRTDHQRKDRRLSKKNERNKMVSLALALLLRQLHLVCGGKKKEKSFGRWQVNHTGETSREWCDQAPQREKAATTGCGHLQPKAKKKKMKEKQVERWANGRRQRRGGITGQPRNCSCLPVSS